MRVDFIECDDIYYTSFMGCGTEINRLIKRLWKNTCYDFSFCEKPRCNSSRIYQLDITYNDGTSRYDVFLCGQETVIANLMNSKERVISTSSYSYGEETL
jgi:hypothetical protein|nr:MAG TPA_asm: hypothetical protein [Caudoviricetes sp.]